MFAELLVNIECSVQLTPKNQSHTLNSICENLKDKTRVTLTQMLWGMLGESVA